MIFITQISSRYWIPTSLFIDLWTGRANIEWISTLYKYTYIFIQWCSTHWNAITVTSHDHGVSNDRQVNSIVCSIVSSGEQNRKIKDKHYWLLVRSVNRCSVDFIPKRCNAFSSHYVIIFALAKTTIEKSLFKHDKNIYFSRIHEHLSHYRPVIHTCKTTEWNHEDKACQITEQDADSGM